jgi:hypothetical protein
MLHDWYITVFFVILQSSNDLPVSFQLEVACSRSRAALAVMFKRSKLELEEQADQIRNKDKIIELLTAQLQATRQQLFNKEWQVIETQQQLQLREQQLAVVQQTVVEAQQLLLQPLPSSPSQQ